jgi:hypothetical protein
MGGNVLYNDLVGQEPEYGRMNMWWTPDFGPLTQTLIRESWDETLASYINLQALRIIDLTQPVVDGVAVVFDITHPYQVEMKYIAWNDI